MTHFYSLIHGKILCQMLTIRDSYSFSYIILYICWCWNLIETKLTGVCDNSFNEQMISAGVQWWCYFHINTYPLVLPGNPLIVWVNLYVTEIYRISEADMVTMTLVFLISIWRWRTIHLCIYHIENKLSYYKMHDMICIWHPFECDMGLDGTLTSHIERVADTSSIWLVRVPSKPISHENGCHMHFLAQNTLKFKFNK